MGLLLWEQLECFPQLMEFSPKTMKVKYRVFYGINVHLEMHDHN